MTTLTMSGSADGHTTTLWSRSLVLVSSRRACRPAIVGERLAEDRGPAGRVRARGVEVAHQVGGQARRGEHGERQRPLGTERPGPAAEAKLLDARGRQRARCASGEQLRPESSVPGAASWKVFGMRASSSGYAPGADPSAVQAPGRIEGCGAAHRRSRPARAARTGGWRRGRTWGARREAYPCSAERARSGVVRRCTWYGRPGVVRACARPSTLPPGDKGAIALTRGRA